VNDRAGLNGIDCLAVARQAMRAEAEAILLAAERLNGDLITAASMILEHPGRKVIVTGVGKSGHIGQKLVATFCSTGTPAVFLHATEAVHGDLGIYVPGDPTILISKSGTTAELVRLIPVLREFQSPLIGILGNINSPLARAVDVMMDASVVREADPLNLAPTSSSAVALAIGDALAAVLIEARGFNAQDFARYHPSGQLGRSLWLNVLDLMHPFEKIATVSAQTTVRQVVIAMTRYPLGAACVVDEECNLLGIMTDGDMRRILQTDRDLRTLPVTEVMTVNPVMVNQHATVKEAVDLMENRPSQISVLPVVDDARHCVGLIRIHDIYQADMR